MSESPYIWVRVVEHKGRGHLSFLWVHPHTKKRKTESSYVDPATGKRVRIGTDRNTAEKLARIYEQFLNTVRFPADSKALWLVFRTGYEEHAAACGLSGLLHRFATVADWVEKLLAPKWLADLSPERLLFWQDQLRANSVAQSTIGSYSACLRAALKWAVVRGMLAAVPNMVVRTQKSDGISKRLEAIETLLRKIAAALLIK